MRQLTMEPPTYIILFIHLINLVLGFQEEYRGFDNCGSGGWHCDTNENGFEVSYKCSNYFEGARVWLWTARIPSPTVSYVIQDCDHVELHLDCTMGYRSYSLRQFHVKNVGHLEILRPLRPQVFLHDNDQLPHAPPEFIMTNVKRVTWFPGVFNKAVGRCRTKQQFMQKLDFTNVTLPNFEADIFNNQSLSSFSLNNVTIDSLEKDSLVVFANTINIRESQLHTIKEGAITLQADNVRFSGNSIKTISKNAISILSHTFHFDKNSVSVIEENGFVIKAHLVNFTDNHFLLLKEFALASIEPGEKWFEGYRSFNKFVYEFKHNILLTLNFKSFKPDFSSYRKSCSEIIIEDNIIKCECGDESPQEPGWWKKDFPELFATSSNRCLQSYNFSLISYFNHCRDIVCNDNITVEECFDNLTDFSTTEEASTPETTLPNKKNNLSGWTEAAIFNFTLPKENEPTPATKLQSSTTGTIIWTVFGTLIFLAILGGVAYWINKKRRENIMKSISSYKHQNQVIATEDHEILIERSGDLTPLTIESIPN